MEEMVKLVYTGYSDEKLAAMSDDELLQTLKGCVERSRDLGKAHSRELLFQQLLDEVVRRSEKNKQYAAQELAALPVRVLNMLAGKGDN